MRTGSRYVGIGLVSAATLLFELCLTRIFAVAEWYHLAFFSINVALLGYAASGAILALLSPLWRARIGALSAPALPLGILLAYEVINRIPFDSYTLAWNPRQYAYLAVYYLSLVIPFALSGLAVSYWLASSPATSHKLYAANLCGSALGSLGLLAALPALGAEGAIIAAAAIGWVGAGVLLRRSQRSAWIVWMLAFGSVALATMIPSWRALRLSPYKNLSYALQAPGAQLVEQRWSIHSRLDVVASPSLHSAPGLSLNYAGVLPLQYGLTLDGDNLSPISRRTEPGDEAFLVYLPSSIPFAMRPSACALITQPRGGMDVAVALNSGASQVVIVEDQPLVAQVVRDRYGAFTGYLYSDPRVTIVTNSPRSALQRGEDRFDVILFSLAESYHPLTSGAYSLSENHLYTVEALTQALRRLDERGLLVISRWLQDPPSECVRAGALMAAALERYGVRDAAQHVIAFRSWSTITILASPTPFGNEDIALARDACQNLAYDMVYYPGVTVNETNRFNRLAEPVYYDAFQSLLSPSSRRAFLSAQFYDITPPTDDHPFFGHFFLWRQVTTILAQIGKTWQPFGGSGFLLVIALLVGAILAAVVLIVLPRLAGRMPPGQHKGAILIYFAALGLGYLMIEMPLMQQFILYLDQPALSFSIVLTTLLLASGIGSMTATRVSLRRCLIALIAVLIVYQPVLSLLFEHTIAWPLASRVALSIGCLFPLGALMGVPFAAGLLRAERIAPGLTPWIWAINGSASVISSVLAMILALTFGYHVVLMTAGGCYLTVFLVAGVFTRGMVESSASL